jgi:hypothetical protein
MLAFF